MGGEGSGVSGTFTRLPPKTKHNSINISKNIMIITVFDLLYTCVVYEGQHLLSVRGYVCHKYVFKKHSYHDLRNIFIFPLYMKLKYPMLFIRKVFL